MDFDPFSEVFLADPYPRYEALRRSSPCHHDPTRDVWLISRHADVVAVLRDPTTFSSSGGVGYVPVADPERGGILISTDPPRHTSLRRFIQPSFAPDAMAKLTAFIEQRVETLVSRAVEQRVVDVVRELAEPLPVAVSAELLGFPTEMSASFAGWSDAIFLTMGPLASADADRIGATIGALAGYVLPLVQQGRFLSGKLADVILRDARASGALTESEAFSLILSVFAAGIDTTIHAISNGLAALATHPEAWQRLRASPQLVGAAVEEMLRFDAPIQAFFRTTTREVVIADVTIPAGARVMALFGSANRDPRRFPDPDSFRIDREPSGQLAFGAGIHLCLGAPLARLELTALLAALVRRVPRLSLAGKPMRRARAVVRGYARLPIEFAG